ncbi:hypothetical protein GCM10022205_37350 [Spinactinospora alkalitolerans]
MPIGSNARAGIGASRSRLADSATAIIPTWDSQWGWERLSRNGIVVCMDGNAGGTCNTCRGRGWRWVRARRSLRRADFARLDVQKSREDCWDCGGSGETAVVPQEGAA